jgi:arabinan endo-1,5-alpha-L-arabinosidase
MTSRIDRRAPIARHARRALLAAAALLTPALAVADDDAPAPALATVRNPIVITMPTGGRQGNCADPTIVRGRAAGDPYWYAYCTSDSLADGDVDAQGARRFHFVPQIRSRDLLTWEYVGDAFAAPPSWAAPTAGVWAPEVVYRNGLYYLYYVATDVADGFGGEPGCGSDSAIGVATSASPTGPWVDAGAPVVAPRRAGPGCNFFWTYDPDVLDTAAGAYLYYGSYYGGIEVRRLSADGRVAPADTAVPVTIPNRYEGAEVVARDGWYYLFASASNCCNGPLTGYQVFAGRSASPLGPFVDRQGVSLRDARVGGSPVITLNGNRWVGTGHNSVFQDAAGNWFTLYHAVDRDDPYFAGSVGYTKRPALLDRLTWRDGWPKVRGGLGPSDTPQLAPVAQPTSPGARGPVRDLLTGYADLVDPQAYLLGLDALNVGLLQKRDDLSEEFDGPGLAPAWQWVREPGPGGWGFENGALRFDSQNAELFGGSNSAAVLAAPTPAEDYVVEAKLALDLPPEGCCFNYAQAGLVIYGGDDDYLKLTHVSIWETRQTEFAKEVSSAAPGFPFNGSSVGAAPAETTFLRVTKVTANGRENYASQTSRDGATWVRGAVWDHALGAGARLGLVSFGGEGFRARFDYVRVYTRPARTPLRSDSPSSRARARARARARPRPSPPRLPPSGVSAAFGARSTSSRSYQSA